MHLLVPFPTDTGVLHKAPRGIHEAPLRLWPASISPNTEGLFKSPRGFVHSYAHFDLFHYRYFHKTPRALKSSRVFGELHKVLYRGALKETRDFGKPPGALRGFTHIYMHKFWSSSYRYGVLLQIPRGFMKSPFIGALQISLYIAVVRSIY